LKQDEIIEMARQVGLPHWYQTKEVVNIELLEAFAKLVAAKEREACAKICKKHADVYAGFEQNPTTQSAWAACADNYDAIRARGEA
jgi:hypothetical protein